MLNRLWREWVYDSAYKPIEWRTHPHCAFKIVARLVSSFLGSVVPVGLTLIRITQSGALKSWLDGTMESEGEMAFEIAAVTFIVVWIIGVINVAASEEKSLRKYIALGALPTSGMTLLFLAVKDLVQ